LKEKATDIVSRLAQKWKSRNKNRSYNTCGETVNVDIYQS